MEARVEAEVATLEAVVATLEAVVATLEAVVGGELVRKEVCRWVLR